MFANRLRKPKTGVKAVRIWIATTLILGMVVTGCTSPGSSAGPAEAQKAEAQKAAGPKRITAAIMSDPAGISRVFITAGAGSYPGGDALEELLNAGLSRTDNQGLRLPQLAEAVPSLENGLWKVLPDGRMETTWKIRSDAVWHDGRPIASADVLFDARLEQDKDLPIFGVPEWELVESIHAVDERTVTLQWKQIFIRADSMFEVVRPKHIIEGPYAAEDKLSILSHPYWADEHVGAGPFKLRQWVRGSHVIAEAFDGYVLGRPKIDEITIKFIPDGNALIANILAGEVQLTLGRNLSLQQAMQLREHWREGGIDIGFTNWIALYPQFLNPTPPVLANVNFRRAIIHALDRQQLVETLQYGVVPLAHAFVNPTEPVYKEIEPSIVKYDHDPRRSMQLIEGLGYARGPDGLFQDATGQRLPLEVRTSGGDDTHEAGILAVSDYLRRVGVAAEPFAFPQAQREDRAANVSYPGLRLWRLPNGLWDLNRYHSSQAGTPENNFRQTSNRARYMNPELDALIDRYMATISAKDRSAILAQILQHQTDRVTVIGLWYNTEAIAVASRLDRVFAKKTGEGTQIWNAHEWDIAS